MPRTLRCRKLGATRAAVAHALAFFLHLLVAFSLGGVGLAVPAAADESPPSTLDATTHDLILLNSGEWLQGDIERIRDDTVYFDSVELGDLEIDLADVAQIVTERPHTLRFEGNRDILIGPILMSGEEFIVGGEARPRSAFMSMIKGRPREINYWNGMLSVGYTIRSGNTDQSDLTVLAKLNRETALTRLTNTYNAAFSTGNDDAGNNTTTANSHRLNSAFDYYVSNRLYLIVPAMEVFADEFQNIQLRLTPSAGLGFDVLDLSKLDWSISAALGYQYTDRVSVEAGESTRANDVAVILATSLNLDPTSRIEWDTNYAAQLIATNMGLTNHHLTSLLSVDLIGNFDLDVTFNFDRVEQPVAEEDGAVPKQNDYRLTVGLGYDF
jgi:putative salt-induced outer membrane protein YdiY